MTRGAFLVGIGAAIAAIATWWRGRPAGELQAELEDLAGMSPDARELAAIALEPNAQAFLAMIRVGEGTASPDGYRTLFGGALFYTFADHPRNPVAQISGDSIVTSSAAGAYQILTRTWDDIAPGLALPDFSPQSQDIAAIALIRRRGALADVREGRFEDAVAKCAKEWASLPGSPYGQPTITLARARDVYAGAGGAFA